MWKTFHCTSIGYSHIKANKVCQDHSDSYEDEERKIVTACDGHGGKLYIRSDRGSRFASEAIITVFRSLDERQIERLSTREGGKKLRLEILCEWNARVERDLAEDPITEEETESLDEEKRFRLLTNPVKAYGTTLHGAMVLGNKIICAGIGDGGIFFLKGKTLSEMTEEEDDEPVANITYSMCQEDAYNHIAVGVFDTEGVDAVIVCTDGTVNPYRNYENFRLSFVLPLSEKLKEGKGSEAEEFMVRLGTEIGIGDDVSVAVLYPEEEKTTIFDLLRYRYPNSGERYTYQKKK